MKRLSPPTGEKPTAYETSQPVVQTTPSFLDTTQQTVPPKSLHNFNLKRLKSFKQIRRKYKMSNAAKVFQEDLSTVLGEYPAQKHQLDSELLVLVLDIAEQYFIYGTKEERSQLKVDAVKQLMTKYFHNDEELLDKMVSEVWHRVKKTSLLKRLFRRFSNRFFLK